MLKRIFTFIFTLMLFVSNFNISNLKAEGEFKQIEGSDNPTITKGFNFENGINPDVNFTKAAVFVDTNQTVDGAKRGIKVGETVTVKIPNGFKYMDGSTYDIYVEVTTTKDLASGSTWICQTVKKGNYVCMELSPFNKQVWSGDPYVTFNYAIYLLDKDGNDAIKENDIDLTAGSCWTAVNEGARPWGNDNTIYTNIPANVLKYETEVKGKNGVVYTGDDANCWHITNGSYNQLEYYILGHGTTTITTAYEHKNVTAIRGGYIRNSESGSAEMMFGYFKSVAGSDYIGYYDGKAHTITVDTSKSNEDLEYCEGDKATCSLKSAKWTSSPATYTNVKLDSNNNPVKRYISHKTKGGSEIIENYVLIKPLPIKIAPKALDRTYIENDASATLLGNDNKTSLSVSNPLTIKTGVNNEEFDIYKLEGKFDNENVGYNKTVNLSYTKNENDSIVSSNNTGFIKDNYIFKLVNPTASITKASLGSSKATPYTGIYDGDYHNISIEFIDAKGNLVDLTSTNDYTVEYTTSETGFNNGFKDVKGDEETYTVNYKISKNGDDTDYETLSGSSTVTIKRKTIYLTPSAESRAYKKNDTSATVNDISETSTGIKDEKVSIKGLTGNFDDDKVGNNKKVNVDSSNASITFSSNDANNYNVIINNTNANIYEATINDIVVTPYVGYYDGEYHNIKVSGKYVDKVKFYLDEAHTSEITNGYKDVTTDNNGVYTVYYEVSDVNSNYANKSGSSTVEIKPLPISITPTANNKKYDGKTDATINNVNDYKTGIGSETISVSDLTGSFEDENAGKNKKVTITNKDACTKTPGTDTLLSDYEITINDTYATIYSADIDNLSASPYIGVYDGKYHNITVSSATSETIKYYINDGDNTCNISDLSGCKELSADENGNIGFKDVGIYTVYYIDTDTNKNYNDATGYSTVSITQRKVYITPTADNKEYDGNTTATVNDVNDYKTGIGSETIFVSDLTGNFEDANVGNDKQVIVNKDNANITPGDNTNLSNYEVIINNTTASIFAKDQDNVTVTPYVGYYDGKEHNITIIGDYAKNIKYYADENHNTPITGYTNVTNENGGIYTVYYEIEDSNANYRNKKGSSTVEIKPLPISITPTANNKKYDGKTDATVNDVNDYKTGIGSETISVSNLKGTFDTAEVGDGKKVTITNKDDCTKTPGNDTLLSNYEIIINDTSAKITAKEMIVVATPCDKYYDGQDGGILVNAYDKDGNDITENVTIKYYEDEALSKEDIMTSHVSLDANGEILTRTVYYTVSLEHYKSLSGSSTVTIRPIEIEISPMANSKVYDGSTEATINELGDINTGIKDEAINISGLSGEFLDANVGTNKKVVVDERNTTIKALENTLLSDYDIKVLDTTGNITPLPITLKADDKTIDAGQSVSFTYSKILGDLIGEDTIYSIGNFKASVDGDYSKANIYEIKLTGHVTNTNYNVTLLPGTLMVKEDGYNIFENVVDYNKLFTDVSMANDVDELYNGSDTIFTKADKENFENGTYHYGVVWLEITETDLDSIEDEYIDQIKLLAKQSINAEPKQIYYFDALMYKRIDNLEQEEIHDTTKDIIITVKLPNELINNNNSMIRKYQIIRYHEIDNSVELIPTTLNADNTITFKTSKFSTYALAYADTLKPSSPNNNGGTKNDNNTTNTNVNVDNKDTTTSKETYVPLSCEDYMKSKDWTWNEKKGKCVYKVSNTNSK